MSTGLADVRTAFLEYFAKQNHSIMDSSPLVPLNDPTLLFTNAGMVQFKNYFTGQETPITPRAVTSQKCVRAGGKHNDLDNVGYTARHHTFFEMLGNFSFGDYFKEEAIYYAWEFLTKELGLPKDKLVATVYAEDDEAYMLWQKIASLGDDKIIRIASSDNFWSMGDTGPCGPCSEIFFDHGEAISGGPPGSPDENGDRFIEIWNLVFMQYEQHADGTRTDLPHPSIDTGMGLERIGAVVQGKHDNYDTDLMSHLIKSSADYSGASLDGAHHNSHRVIADHLRSSAFLIADGVLPSNEGRGYVLRRIMRRAMRHAQLLGAQEPLLWQLVPALKMQMVVAYPELERASALIVETLRHEEERFRETLSRGLKLLEDEVSGLKGKELPGDVAFKLYDTYGFPLDLTQDAMRERGLGVDIAGFDAAMDKQRADARANWSGSGEAATEQVWFELLNDIGATEFVGYQGTEAEAVITALVENGELIETATAGQDVMVLVNQTPFYAESGGQVGDTGTLKTEQTKQSASLSIYDTQKKLGVLHAHLCKIENIENGELSVGDTVHLSVNTERRDNIRTNHSATHLLHEALRRVLGDHVSQKGSLVTDEGLRFDFSQPKGLTEKQVLEVEDIVNTVIRKNNKVTTRLMTPDEAIQAGALALFGEKYSDEVRVLSMGNDEGNDESHFSVELCGGTHVNRLGDISLFKIISEGAVASGVRRIEARTADGARHYLQQQEHYAKEAARVLKVGVPDLAERVAHLVDEKKRLEKELSEAQKKLALNTGMGTAVGSGAQSSCAEIEEVNGLKFIGRVLDGIPAKELRGLVDEGKKQIGSGVVVFIALDDGKASISVGVTDDLTDRQDAVALVQLGASKLGGKGGGGRADFAQAGGSDVSGAEAAIEAVKSALLD